MVKILCRYCLLQVMGGKNGRKVKKRCVRRCKQLLDDLKEMTGYLK